MSKHRHILVLDPIGFRGGSKVATEALLDELDIEENRITVLTSDQSSWQLTNVARKKLWELESLSHRESGVLYLIRHLLIALQVLLFCYRNRPVDIAIGASGPGVDLALYLARPLLRYRLFQLVHGPTAASRTIGRCLARADRVFYLEGTQQSLVNSLACYSGNKAPLDSIRFRSFSNGLASSQWPTATQSFSPRLLWAASLLKWKGVETFLAARDLLSEEHLPPTDLCFIKPQQSKQPISQVPKPSKNLHCHESPADLDAIRARCNVFVSTSEREPFGLSILEALAAGLCVVIPADNAYWDNVLIDGVDCIKYQPNSAESLAQKIQFLKEHPATAFSIGLRGQELAKEYRASNAYAEILGAIQTTQAGL